MQSTQTGVADEGLGVLEIIQEETRIVTPGRSEYRCKSRVGDTYGNIWPGISEGERSP